VCSWSASAGDSVCDNEQRRDSERKKPHGPPRPLLSNPILEHEQTANPTLEHEQTANPTPEHEQTANSLHPRGQCIRCCIRYGICDAPDITYCHKSCASGEANMQHSGATYMCQFDSLSSQRLSPVAGAGADLTAIFRERPLPTQFTRAGRGWACIAVTVVA
jgi:hypothetical protein